MMHQEPFPKHSIPVTPEQEVTERLPPKQLIDRTFLMPPDDYGNQKRTTIVSVTGDLKDGNAKSSKLNTLIDGDNMDSIAYIDICDYIKHEDGHNGEFSLCMRSLYTMDPLSLAASIT
jgi:hypothetical protein